MDALPEKLRLKVLLGAAFSGLMAWWMLPGSGLDKLAFSTVARGSVNPPYFVGGFGSRETPWSLRSFSAGSASDRRHAPLIVALGDDPEGVFQTSPPSPVDLAVVFSNFQRLGAKKAACAAVLSWDEPDMIGLTALETTLGKFESLVMAAPVSRGATPEPLPAAFRRGSLPLEAVKGDVGKIPVVNRIPVSGVILLGGKTLAGFQVIDSEAAGGAPFLLARWDERVLLSFPLMVVMQRLEVPVDALEIRPGAYVKLGKGGPTIPIDEYGRMTSPVPRTKPFARIVAEDLIDGGDDLFPRLAPDPVILRDDRSSVEAGTSRFSEEVASVVAAISSDSGMGDGVEYRRPGAMGEWLMLVVVSGLMAVVAGLAGNVARICLGVMGAGVLMCQFIGFGMAEVWLPGLSAFAAMGGGWVAAKVVVRRSKKVDVKPMVDREVDETEEMVEESIGFVEPEGGEISTLESVSEATVEEPVLVVEEPALPEEIAAEVPKKKARAPRKRKTESAAPLVVPEEVPEPKPKRTRARKVDEVPEEAPKKVARKTPRKKPTKE